MSAPNIATFFQTASLFFSWAGLPNDENIKRIAKSLDIRINNEIYRDLSDAINTYNIPIILIAPFGRSI